MLTEIATTDLGILLPEIIMLTMACVILLIDAYLPSHLRDLTYQLTQGTLVATAFLVIGAYPDKPLLAMQGMYMLDPMAAVLKAAILLIVLVAFVYAKDYLKARNFYKGEFFVLGLFATLGMMVMVSAHNLLIVYLGLELLSLSLYAMVAMHRDSVPASEAAMKYFVLGALASGMLLYGMSMLYGFTGSLDLNAIASKIASIDAAEHMPLVFALVFIIIGLGFKFGAVPFHMWVPDVYQGSPTAVTLFISSAPKIAAFAMLMRLLVDGMGPLSASWQDILIVLALLSIATGNVIAIVQTNIKRMLAYSTISHVGFLFLGVLTATPEGYAASMFYVVAYSIMSLAGFGMVLLLSRAGFESDEITDFKGLNERNSWYAALMTIVMLSMAGVPPMLGFWAKFSVLNQVINAGYVWLAVVVVLFSVIGAFYYLRVIWMMYFEKLDGDAAEIEVGMDMQVVLSVNGLLVLGMGVAPQFLMGVCFGALGVGA